MTASDPRVVEIQARHADSVRLLVARADEDGIASVYEEADGLDTICTIPGFYPAVNQNLLAESIAQMWEDRDYLLAELADRDEKLARVEALVKYLDPLAPGDKHYASLIRAAVAAATGDGE